MVVKQKTRAFPTLNLISNFKLLETHLPVFTTFKALRDGFSKACEFHLPMTIEGTADTAFSTDNGEKQTR